MTVACYSDFRIVATKNTLGSLDVFRSASTAKSWGYNRGMANSGIFQVKPLSVEIVEPPIFEPFTPEQEKMLIAEVEELSFLFGDDIDPWGENAINKKEVL